jgi:hypothetical protein
MKQQVYDEHPFLAKMRAEEKITIDGGTKIQVPIRYKKLDKAGSAGFREQFVFEGVQTRTAIELDWKAMKAETVLFWDEKIKNAGSGRIINLAKEKATELKEDFLDKMATKLLQVHTDVGDLDFESLDNIVDDSTSYGGLNPGDTDVDLSEWASTVDSSTTALNIYGSNSLSYMRSQATFGKREPTMHLTTRELFTKYESIIQPQQRYEDKQMANLGFSTLTFHKKPVVEDPYVLTGYWYGIDTNAFEIFVKEGEDMDVSDWFSLEQAGYPKTTAKYMTAVLNIICRMRKTSFKFEALDYTE